MKLTSLMAKYWSLVFSVLVFSTTLLGQNTSGFWNLNGATTSFSGAFGSVSLNNPSFASGVLFVGSVNFNASPGNAMKSCEYTVFDDVNGNGSPDQGETVIATASASTGLASVPLPGFALPPSFAHPCFSWQFTTMPAPLPQPPADDGPRSGGWTGFLRWILGW